MKAKRYPGWQEIVTFSADRPSHKKLIEADDYHAVVVGLEPGQKIPPHPSSTASYHFLDGSGWMVVDGDRLAVERGATVVVPSGVPRGVEADTRLAFIGSHGGAGAKVISWKPNWKTNTIFGLMALFGLVIMGGLMSLAASPLATMYPAIGSMGLGAWGAMILPLAGLLGMFVMMFFMFRWMRSGGQMSGMAGHMSMMKGHSQHATSENSKSENKEETVTTLTYSIPSVSCDHCKLTIERELSDLVGVSSVSVDVGGQQAIIKYDSPATKAEIEALLVEIGYAPETQ